MSYPTSPFQAASSVRSTNQVCRIKAAHCACNPASSVGTSTIPLAASSRTYRSNPRPKQSEVADCPPALTISNGAAKCVPCRLIDQNAHLARIADDDELPTTFDHVKAPDTHIFDQPVATDFAFNILDLTPHDAAGLLRFGPEYLVAPLGVAVIVSKGGFDHLHGLTKPDSGKGLVKASPAAPVPPPGLTAGDNSPPHWTRIWSAPHKYSFARSTFLWPRSL